MNRISETLDKRSHFMYTPCDIMRKAFYRLYNNLRIAVSAYNNFP